MFGWQCARDACSSSQKPFELRNTLGTSRKNFCEIKKKSDCSCSKVCRGWKRRGARMVGRTGPSAPQFLRRFGQIWIILVLYMARERTFSPSTGFGSSGPVSHQRSSYIYTWLFRYHRPFLTVSVSHLTIKFVDSRYFRITPKEAAAGLTKKGHLPLAPPRNHLKKKNWVRVVANKGRSREGGNRSGVQQRD